MLIFCCLIIVVIQFSQAAPVSWTYQKCCPKQHRLNCTEFESCFPENCVKGTVDILPEFWHSDGYRIKPKEGALMNITYSFPHVCTNDKDHPPVLVRPSTVGLFLIQGDGHIYVEHQDLLEPMGKYCVDYNIDDEFVALYCIPPLVPLVCDRPPCIQVCCPLGRTFSYDDDSFSCKDSKDHKLTEQFFLDDLEAIPAPYALGCEEQIHVPLDLNSLTSKLKLIETELFYSPVTHKNYTAKDFCLADFENQGEYH